MVGPINSRWFTVEQQGDVSILRFAHTRILDDEIVDEIHQQLIALLAHENRRLFVLNFSPVTGLASRMLGEIIGMHKRLQAMGGRLALCAVSPFLYEFFKTANLPGLLCIRGTEQEAIHTLTAPPSPDTNP